MRFRLIALHLGLLMIVLGGIAAVVAAWGVFDVWVFKYARTHHAAIAMLITSGVGFVTGGSLWLIGRRQPLMVGRREALLLVAATWVLGALLSALPYWLWAQMDPDVPHDHVFRRYINCLFEATSGLTTSGSTILSDIEALPRAILLWRSLTHWIGGLGIVVLFVAVLPTLGVGGKRIFQIEATKISTGGAVPRIRDAARILWVVYFGLTALEMFALKLCGLSWFDAVLESFNNVSTGGFSTKNLSTAGYHSPAAEWVIVLFTLLACTNFALYYQIMRGQFGRAFRDVELRCFLILITIISLIVLVCIADQQIIGMDGEPVPSQTPLDKVRYAVFNVVVVSGTCGFATADFDRWPDLARFAIYFGSFVGACAGSTGGGLKVIRFWIVTKVIFAEIGRVFRPSVVKPLRVGHTTVDEEMKSAVLSYVAAFTAILITGTALLMVLEFRTVDFGTALTSTIAAICTTGPGLGMAGPTENFAWYGDASKLLLMVLMLVGRLEIFAIFVLFVPAFWHKH